MKMATNNKDKDDFSNSDLKSILNIVVSKIESYEQKIDNIETKISDLSVIKHQMDNFTRQFTEIQSDLRSLRIDLQDLKSVEYKVDDISKWKSQIDQTLTINDMANMKTKQSSQEVIIIQLTEKLNSLKEDIKKETTGRSLLVGGSSAGIITALVQIISYLIKN